MYKPTKTLYLPEPCADIADTLIDALRESNGLDAMPPEQRLELIRLLSLPNDSIHDEPGKPQWQVDLYAQLAEIQELAKD